MRKLTRRLAQRTSTGEDHGEAITALSFELRGRVKPLP